MPPLSASGARVLHAVEIHRKQQKEVDSSENDGNVAASAGATTSSRPASRRGGRPHVPGSTTSAAPQSTSGNYSAFLTPLSLAVAVRGASAGVMPPLASPLTTRRRATDAAVALATSALAALGDSSDDGLGSVNGRTTTYLGGGAQPQLRASPDGDTLQRTSTPLSSPRAAQGNVFERVAASVVAGISSPRAGGGLPRHVSAEHHAAAVAALKATQEELRQCRLALASLTAAHAETLTRLAALDRCGASSSAAEASRVTTQQNKHACPPPASPAVDTMTSFPSAVAPQISRLRALLLWYDFGSSARTAGGCGYVLLCIRWGTRAMSLTAVSAALHAALLLLALGFLRQRVGRFTRSMSMTHETPSLASTEEAIRRGAISAAASTAALISRAAPVLAEGVHAARALMSGSCPVVTFRVAIALWVSAKTVQLIELSPWHAAWIALIAAFTLPLTWHSHGEHIKAIGAGLNAAARLRWDDTPTGVRWLGTSLLAWIGWHVSGRGTRAFAVFLAIVKVTEMLHAYAESLRSAQTCGSSVVLTELQDDLSNIPPLEDSKASMTASR